MVIESTDNKKIKDFRKLKQKKYRDKEKMFLVEGIHLVVEAYKSGNLIEVILEENEKVDINIKTTYVTKQVLKSLSELETPYNIIGVCKFSEEKDIGNKVLILDDIQDPGNLGTIIRSALAFNIDTIILSDNTVDLYNSKVLRSSQGMNFHVNILRGNIKEYILKLKDDNFKIYTTDVNNGKDIKSVTNTKKYAIIMGNEGRGVFKGISDLSDDKIYIKMNRECESLNVAVATSIILYELNK
ncbi:MAG: RNA methyltransferase [Bacilli bacterium]|nr:RNA methyltransferase [Bacilli bacterium]